MSDPTRERCLAETVTREEWLTTVAHRLRPLFHEAKHALPANVRISVGFPSHGALSLKAPVIGQCFYDSASADGCFEVFISPVLGDAHDAASVLVHELCHAVLPQGSKHGPVFVKMMRLVGLEGKPTATIAGPELTARLKAIVETVGAYPHAKLSPMVQVKRQVNRMVKVACGECGYLARVARKWLEVGPPLCPTHQTPLSQDEEDGE